MNTIKRIFTFVFGTLLRRDKSALAKTIPDSPIPSAVQVIGPMAFKGGTVHTLITPIGSYAGKSTVQPMRALAEQRFNETNSSRGATIN